MRLGVGTDGARLQEAELISEGSQGRSSSVVQFEVIWEEELLLPELLVVFCPLVALGWRGTLCWLEPSLSRLVLSLCPVPVLLRTLGSDGAVVLVVVVMREAVEESPNDVSAIFWPAHMAFRVWKTAWGATFIFRRSTMILKTSWSMVMPAACVSSNSSLSSALRIFFFFIAYFVTFPLTVTPRAGESGAEGCGADCCEWDISYWTVGSMVVSLNVQWENVNLNIMHAKLRG